MFFVKRFRLGNVVSLVIGVVIYALATAAAFSQDQTPETTLAIEGPSFNCEEAVPGTIEAMICSDAELSALDRAMAEVYAAALASSDGKPGFLKTEQRGWIKGRDDCWQSDNERQCVAHTYQHRIAELQASYNLVPGTGPVSYFCAGHTPSTVVVHFYATEPPTLVARRGDSLSVMFLAPSASGARYIGQNESFWEHGGEALVSWGYNAPPMHCETLP